MTTMKLYNIDIGDDTKVCGYTKNDFKNDLEYCLGQITSVPEYSYLSDFIYSIEFFTSSHTLGMCQRIKKVPDLRIIKLNTIVTDNIGPTSVGDSGLIKQVIMHELCHCITNGEDHTGAWKIAANYMNTLFGYNISRTATIPPEVKQAMIDNRTYKYKIQCCGCNNIFYYSRRSPFTDAVTKSKGTTPIDYTCTQCKSKVFKLTNLV